MTIQKNPLKEQVKQVIAQANYNRNVNGLLKPEDKQSLGEMIGDIDNKISELNEEKLRIQACIEQEKPLYS